MAKGFLDAVIGQVGPNPKSKTVTWLPEPEPQPRHFTVVSVDDHLVEPPDTFEGRVPAKFADSAPKLIERDGVEGWWFEDTLYPIVGASAAVGRPPSEYTVEPVHYSDMRKGVWDVHARVKDMDLNGVYASMCFPSNMPGFGGALFSFAQDRELGLASMRAWNQWHLEDWCGTYPGRLIPCQIAWLADPELAAQEIRANAERGFRAVTFPEFPEKLGLPSVNTDHWDPILAACVETETVLCLHVGSGSWVATGSSDSPPDVIAALFSVASMIATVDWLFAGVPVRFPELRIAIAEGGIGWVPSMLDRLEHCTRYREFTGGWPDIKEDPGDVLRRNFWFCALDDTAGFEQLDYIGDDHILLEVDYPHLDTTWPNTQRYLAQQLAPLSDDVIRKVTWENAARLFRLDIPADVVASTVPYVRPTSTARVAASV